MPRDKSVAEVKAELQRVLTSELATRKFSYPRSDGSAWTLTLRDVIDRRWLSSPIAQRTLRCFAFFCPPHPKRFDFKSYSNYR